MGVVDLSWAHLGGGGHWGLGFGGTPGNGSGVWSQVSLVDFLDF